MRLLLLALLPSLALADVTVNGAVSIDGPPDGGSIRTTLLSENDDGTHGVSQYLSPETDLDYRLRTASDMLLDHETFSYVAQNTGKQLFANTTMAATWNAGNFLTNSGSITTITTGLSLSSRAYFPILGTSTLSIDAEVAFSAATIPTNTTIDIGAGLPGAANPYTPTDGCWFRGNAAGFQGVCSHNGAETSTGVFADFVPVANRKYQLIVYIHQRAAEFWIGESVEDVHMHGLLEVPDGQGQVLMGQSAAFLLRHAIAGGAASGLYQVQLAAYSVRIGGPSFSREFGGGEGNALYGSYQGMSGGTMGSLANYANSANPTAAVPTNTTAALGSGAGGQFWEIDTLAVTIDGVISSYRVPAATVNIAGRRMRVQGVKIDSYIQTALTGGGYVAQWSLAFGHTAVSLGTGESATTKAPRRIPLGVQTVASGAVALTQLATVAIDLNEAPIYVNPGEFVQVVKKKVGTAPSAGVVAHTIVLVYSWE